MTRKSLRVQVVLFFAATMVVATSNPAPAQSIPGFGRIMTYNVNEGTDFQQVVGAQSLDQFLLGVGQVLTQVQGTNPPERMRAIAQEILKVQPELVSLQEVDQWYSGNFDLGSGTCGTLTLQYDMLQELLDSLSALGGHYQIAIKVPQYVFPPTPGLVPPSVYICVSLNDYNVILARADLPSRVFQWSNAQSGQFKNALILPTPIGNVPLPRSWASVEARFFGCSFLFVDTHLESFDPTMRQLQGEELRAGPANSALPVVIAMDANAQAFPLPQDPTYSDFRLAGFADVWSTIFPKRRGFTCCQDEADNNARSELFQRIDLILTHGRVTSSEVTLIGNKPESRLPDGLWPSDHAGVAADIIVDR